MDVVDGIYRWGIVGEDASAGAFSRAISDVVDAKLYAVAVKHLSHSHSDSYLRASNKIYDNYEDLILDEQVQLLYVSSDISDRYQHIHAALSCAKGVVYAPSLELSTKQIATLFKKAEEKGVCLMEGLVMSFLPHIRRLRDIVKRGSIGEICGLQADVSRYVPFDPQAPFFDPTTGGLFKHQGLQALAFTANFLKDPEEITGHVHVDVGGIATQYALVLRYAEETYALLSASANMDGTCEAHLIGSKSRVHIHPPFYDQTTVTMYTGQRRSGLMKFNYPSNPYYYLIEEAQRCLGAKKHQSDVWSEAHTQRLSKIVARCQKESAFHQEKTDGPSEPRAD